MVGPTPQMVEVGTGMTGAGTRWRLKPPPRPAALLLCFRPFKGEGIT